MDLDSMKYADLQRLAKDIGLKANMKADKLLKALKQHYKEECCLDTEKPSPNAPLVDNTAFVTKRRGRGKNAKRNNPEEDGGADGDLSQRSVQTDDQLEEAAEGKGSNKRKRISGVYQSGTAEHSVVQEGTLEHQAQPSVADGIEKARTVQGENQRSMKPAGKIPRHEGLLKRAGRPVLNPTTPNFKKLHEAHFNKMESIDSYVQRKNRQVEVFRNSVKELKLLSEKTIPKTTDKNCLKPSVSRASLFSPQSQKTRPVSDKRRLTQLTQPSQKDSSVFRPSILSAKKINVRFSQATKDNERKRSMVKTPARVSPRVPLVSTPGTQSTEERKPALPVSNIKTPGVFVFNGNTSISTTPATNKKNAFDLKASLSRPLTYQPYKGKLKPFGVTQENAVQSQTTQSHQKNYKQHKVQTREERRTKHTDNRKQKKEKILGARRGLVLA